MDNGWIKIHRKMLDWEWYEDTNVFRVFTHILLKANFKDKKWRGIQIKRGSLITSIQNLADETGLTPRKVRVALDKLISTEEVTKRATSHYTYITVNKYDLYQQCDKPVTNKRQTSDKPVTTTKEGKKVRKKEKHIYDFDSFWNLYPKKVARKKNEAIYSKLCVSEEIEIEIMDGLKKYLKKWEADKTETQFIPNPSTWLNQGRWSDELEEVIDHDKLNRDRRERELERTRALLAGR